MDWWIVALVLGELAFLGWVIQIVAHYRLKRQEQRTEERYRVLQRFESVEQLSEFLAGDGGRKLLSSTATQPTSPWTLMLVPMFLGLLCLFVGGGLLISGTIVSPWDSEGFQIGGILLVLAGIALLIGAAWSLRLAKAWGLHPAQIDRPTVE